MDRFLCPICEESIDLLDAIGHILEIHPWTGVAIEMRYVAGLALADMTGVRT